ncbi:hypothetical protein C8F04DRAFT_1280324 [Mycena alexandri]|uniref:DUF6534 domain-containing protein n=1 Tax=Mycena alexandri TaxID=1745969 RepID=A0AAD6RXR3_9AGAR|nr:hypothetical protein C8F04DRAFT_1280324 [Mycena alexandri]
MCKVNVIFIFVDVNGDRTVAALAKPSMKLAVGLTNSFEAAADVVATAAISWEFYRNKGHVQSTNSLLGKLLGFAVGRGALVTIVQLLTLALLELAFLFSSGCRYTSQLSHITMVTILNSRQALRRANQGSVGNDSAFNDMVASRPLSTAPFRLRTLDITRPDGTLGSAL